MTLPVLDGSNTSGSIARYVQSILSGDSTVTYVSYRRSVCCFDLKPNMASSQKVLAIACRKVHQLTTHQTIYVTNSTVGWSIASKRTTPEA